MYPSSIQKLIEQFQVLPSVGPKTAEQYAFALKKLSKEQITQLAKALLELNALSACTLCNALTDAKGLCITCADQQRKRTVLMVLESEPDMESIEKTKRYPGLYYLLGEINEQALKGLVSRVNEAKPPVTEVVLAFDVTPQMELTLFEIKQAFKLAKLDGIKISRLGRGLPTGADLRYADTQTLLGALQHRETL